MSPVARAGKPVGEDDVLHADFDLFVHGEDIIRTLRALLDDAVIAVRGVVAPSGILPDAVGMKEFTGITHPLVWLATCIETVDALHQWALELHHADRLRYAEKLIYVIGLSEYTSMIFNGIPMSAAEVARLTDLGLSAEKIQSYRTPVVEKCIALGTTHELKRKLFEVLKGFAPDPNQPLLPAWMLGDSGLSPSLRHFSRKVRTFLHETVEPYVHAWHLTGASIPLSIIDMFAKSGLLDLSLDRNAAGGGQSRDTLIAVIEEVACSSVTLGSFVRHEVLVSELLRCCGTAEQKSRWLPRIASGELVCALTFTELCSGALLDDIRLRASLDGNVYRLNGHKAFVSNAARADLLVVLARTENTPNDVSFFILEKNRTTEADPFPLSGGVRGLYGSEVQTLGHRGFCQYDLIFEDVTVPAENLVGGAEKLGSRQLIQLQEQDCLNAAAQSIGVGRAAVELTVRHVLDCEHFGPKHVHSARVINKLALMVVHTMAARQLCRSAITGKDAAHFGYIKAGMAKLLASKVAWMCADSAMQLQEANGMNIENPVSRLLTDARVLSLLECPAEFIAERLLEGNSLSN